MHLLPFNNNDDDSCGHGDKNNDDDDDDDDDDNNNNNLSIYISGLYPIKRGLPRSTFYFSTRLVEDLRQM